MIDILATAKICDFIAYFYHGSLQIICALYITKIYKKEGGWVYYSEKNPFITKRIATTAKAEVKTNFKSLNL